MTIDNIIVSPKASLPSPGEFPHIRRMRDTRFPHEIAAILPGEFFVSTDPMIVYTVLGSCIAACIRDPVTGVGGMNHFMLPASSGAGGHDSWGGESTRYGSFAMERLINETLKRGAMKTRLEVKLFGAGKIYEGNINVGERNTAWVLDYLKAEGLPLASSDLGDVWPRKVYYFTQSGRVLLKRIERLKNQTIQERETEYAKHLQEEQGDHTGDITLF